MKLETPLTLIPVAPNGTSTGIGCSFDEHGSTGCQFVEGSSYPSTFMGEFLRRLRVRRKLNLRDAGDALGISIVDFSALERGRYTLSAEDWCHAAAAIHPGTIPWLTAELATSLENSKPGADLVQLPDSVMVETRKHSVVTKASYVDEELRTHVEKFVNVDALTVEQTDALDVLFRQKHRALYSEPFLSSLEAKLFGGMVGGGMTDGGGNRMFVDGSVPETRLIHVEPLQPGPSEEDLFANHELSLEQFRAAFRLREGTAPTRDFNHAVTEEALRFHSDRVRAALNGRFGNAAGRADAQAGVDDSDIITKDERTIQSMIDGGMIELSEGKTARDAAIEYQAVKARAQAGLSTILQMVVISAHDHATPALQRVADDLIGLDEEAREAFPPEPICTCTSDEPLGPICKRAAGRKHGGKPHCPRPCSECSDGAHHFTDLGTVVAFDDDEVSGDSPEAIAENKRHQAHPAAQAGCRVWHECYHCGAWMEFDAGDDEDDDEEDDDDGPDSGDFGPNSQDWCDDCDNFLDDCKCPADKDDGEVGHNEPENLRQPVIHAPVLFEEDDGGEPLIFDNALVAPYANDGRSKPTEDSATKCATGCVIDDLDPVSGGEWHCGFCGRFIPESVVRELGDKGEIRVPLSDETDPFYAYARDAGFLWAYELALSIATRVRFHGLIGIESPDNTVSCWYGCIAQWPPEVVAEAREWVNKTHVKGETVELPKAVQALVDQERSMREADEVGESMWTTCGNQEADGESK